MYTKAHIQNYSCIIFHSHAKNAHFRTYLHHVLKSNGPQHLPHHLIYSKCLAAPKQVHRRTPTKLVPYDTSRPRKKRTPSYIFAQRLLRAAPPLLSHINLLTSSVSTGLSKDSHSVHLIHTIQSQE